jgi:hypothetical protein
MNNMHFLNYKLFKFSKEKNAYQDRENSNIKGMNWDEWGFRNQCILVLHMC